MGETHNLWITVDLCGNFGMTDIPRVPKSSWRHFELRFDALEGEVVQLLGNRPPSDALANPGRTSMALERRALSSVLRSGHRHRAL